MNKFLKRTALLFLLVSLCSMVSHKFYVAIYQIDFAPKKKRLEITTRIFIDDLNEAIEKKYGKIAYIGSDKETNNDIVLLKKYLSEKFQLKVNGQLKSMNFLSKEIENNVVICYLNITDISKITTLEVENSIITELQEEQQNIIKANFNGEKQSLLLTAEKTKGMLK